MARREHFAVTLRKERKTKILAKKRSLLKSRLLPQAAIAATNQENQIIDEDDEGLAEIESLEDLCKLLVRSRRDPDYTPLQYLREILNRLESLEQKTVAD